MSQGQRNGFQSGWAMEHWKVLSATMAGRQEKFLNSRHSKIVTFWPWRQPFNNFYFQILSFSRLFPSFLFATLKRRGANGPPSRPPWCCLPCVYKLPQKRKVKENLKVDLRPSWVPSLPEITLKPWQLKIAEKQISKSFSPSRFSLEWVRLTKWYRFNISRSL